MNPRLDAIVPPWEQESGGDAQEGAHTPKQRTMGYYTSQFLSFSYENISSEMKRAVGESIFPGFPPCLLYLSASGLTWYCSSRSNRFAVCQYFYFCS